MILRYARHTHSIEKIKEFYTKILDLDIIGEFKNHNGYNGLFLGNENYNWHLEFTESNHHPTQIFDDDDILVFYPETEREYNLIINNIKLFKVKTHHAKNPYWNINGILIKDPDGYNIVISKLKKA